MTTWRCESLSVAIFFEESVTLFEAASRGRRTAFHTVFDGDSCSARTFVDSNGFSLEWGSRRRWRSTTVCLESVPIPSLDWPSRAVVVGHVTQGLDALFTPGDRSLALLGRRLAASSNGQPGAQVNVRDS